MEKELEKRLILQYIFPMPDRHFIADIVKELKERNIYDKACEYYNDCYRHAFAVITEKLGKD